MVVERALDVACFDEVRQSTGFRRLYFAHVLAQLRWNIGQVQVSVDGRLVSGRQRMNRSSHAFQVTRFCFGNEAEFVQPQPTVNGPLTHGDVVLFAAGEVGQGEGFNMRGHQSDLSVNGAAGLQLFVVVAPDGVQNVGVNVADGEGFIKDGCVEDEADF